MVMEKILRNVGRFDNIPRRIASFQGTLVPIVCCCFNYEVNSSFMWTKLFASMQNKRRCLLSVIFLAWVGFSLTIVQLVHLDMQQELLRTGFRLSEALDTAKIEGLSFAPGEEKTDAFQQLSRELQQVGAATRLGWSPAKKYVGIYTLRQRNGEFIFGPENIPSDDPQASPPGTVYEEPPAALTKVFATGEAQVVGPFRDEYGRFMSAFVPLRTGAGPVENGVVLGIDIQLQDWLVALFWESILPLGLLAAFLTALASAGFALMERTASLPLGISPCLLVLGAMLLIGVWFVFFLLPSRVVPNESNSATEAQLLATLSPAPVSPPPPDLLEHSLGVPSHRPLIGQAPVRLHGSSTLLPMVRAAAGYLEEEQEVQITWQGGGASAGVQALREGLADMAMLARAPTAEEAQEFSSVTLGWDALAVVVNLLNPVKNLDRMQLRAIFSGEVTNWEENLPGGEQSILVVNRREGRASAELLEVYLLEADPVESPSFAWVETTWTAGANSEVLLWVAGVPHAIGFVSWADTRRFKADGLPVRVLQVDGIKPSVETITDGSYPLVRPLTLLFRGGEDSPATRVAEWFRSPAGKKLLGDFCIPQSLEPTRERNNP
jgi:phosphate transport system substrate-binding protein